MPFYARLWVMLLVIANFIIPLFYLDGLEAKVILATFLVSAFMMTVLTALSGFSRLLGLGHFLWFPLDKVFHGTGTAKTVCLVQSNICC